MGQGRAARAALLSGTAIGVAVMLAGSPVWAQEAAVRTAPVEATLDPRDAEIAELRQSIRDLAAQVADLKAATSSNFRAVRETEDAAPKVSLAGGRPQFVSADGDFKFAIRGLVQFDAAHSSVNPLTAANDLGSGTNFRRARPGFEGTVFKDWNFGLWAELGGTGGETPALNQAYVEYAGWRPFGLTEPVRLRVGAWALPAGLEDATPNTEGLFLERGAIAEMVRGLDAGEGRTGAAAYTNGQHWYALAALTGKVVGVPITPEYRQQEGFVARLALNPLHGADYDVHVGGSVQGIIRPADTAAGPAVAEAVRLQERPELRVSGLRLVDTGAINADAETTYGLEAGASWRNLYLAGEWFQIDVDRTGSATAPSPFKPKFSGWYGQAAWTLTGERHVWTSTSGGFRGIRPAHAFDPSTGSWGAWEIAARYSVLDLNDRSGQAGAAAPAGGVRGGVQKITTVGLNWYPNSVIRFLFDYQWAHVDRLNATGQGIGEQANSISFRSQFAF